MSKTPTTKRSKSPKSDSFTAEERAAMKARAQELKAEERASKNRDAGEQAVQEVIGAMEGTDRIMATRLHEIVTHAAPDLMPKTWYGMPAYAKDGKIVCFFQSAQKFGSRYATFGFNDSAMLDDGDMWPTAFALTELTDTAAAKITDLVKRAVSGT